MVYQGPAGRLFVRRSDEADNDRVVSGLVNGMNAARETRQGTV